MSHILHHELTRIACDAKEGIHEVNRPCDAESIISHHIDRNARRLGETIDRYLVDEAIAELRRITTRQADARVRDLRRSILGTEYVGGALCGAKIRVRPPATWPRAVSTKPQEAP